MASRRQLNQSRRGSATVELALCLPILLAVIFGIIEFSRALQLQQTVRQAAFEAARAGVTLDATTSDVVSAASTITSALAIKNPTITTSPSTLSYNSPTISVTVSTTPASNGWFLWFFNSKSVISATITLDREVQSVSVADS